VATLSKRHPDNAPGPWFVDTTCIDCDGCRQVNPELFVDRSGQSVVGRQPRTSAEERDAAIGLLVCPTGSIGRTGPKPSLEGLLPQELEDGVFLCGYNAESSFGASSFLVRRPGGNVMVDSPRFAAPLVRAIEALGGLAHVVLSHRDDVADARRWAERFGARVWIHEADRDAAPFAAEIVRGRAPTELAPGFTIVPCPGHTRGSVVLHVEDRFLFTGDSLHYSREQGELGAFRDACWYSWEEQTRSLETLLPLRFEWVLAGHGDRCRRDPAWMRASLERLLARMRDPAAPPDGW